MGDISVYRGDPDLQHHIYLPTEPLEDEKFGAIVVFGRQPRAVLEGQEIKQSIQFGEMEYVVHLGYGFPGSASTASHIENQLSGIGEIRYLNRRAGVRRIDDQYERYLNFDQASRTGGSESATINAHCSILNSRHIWSKRSSTTEGVRIRTLSCRRFSYLGRAGSTPSRSA